MRAASSVAGARARVAAPVLLASSQASPAGVGRRGRGWSGSCRPAGCSEPPPLPPPPPLPRDFRPPPAAWARGAHAGRWRAVRDQQVAHPPCRVPGRWRQGSHAAPAAAARELTRCHQVCGQQGRQAQEHQQCAAVAGVGLGCRHHGCQLGQVHRCNQPQRPLRQPQLVQRVAVGHGAGGGCQDATSARAARVVNGQPAGSPAWNWWWWAAQQRPRATAAGPCLNAPEGRHAHEHHHGHAGQGIQLVRLSCGHQRVTPLLPGPVAAAEPEKRVHPHGGAAPVLSGGGHSSVGDV